MVGVFRTGGYLVNLLRYKTSLFETGVVIENQPAMKSGVEVSPLAIFFTRVHFEIFGLFFPVNLPNLGSAVALMTQVYESTNSAMKFIVRVSKTASDGEQMMTTSSTNRNASSNTAKTAFPERYQEDSETLAR